jgi:hypothetical protein
MKKANKSVTICDIAKVLTVDKWFSKIDFCKLTGISMKSCGPRLCAIVNSGHLLKMRGGSSLIYKMTAESKSRMSIREQANAKSHNKRCSGKSAKDDELRMHEEQYSFLRLVKFI